MIDTHCHIDLYENPVEVANECERKGIVTIGMTNLPSHFEMGYPHLRSYKKVRLALGLHPLYAELHKSEFSGFLKNIDNTSYIGEIGLDFSKEGISTKEIQVESFKNILKSLKDKKKIISLHSRKAENEVLQFLIDYEMKSAIFHWYSGPLALISKIIAAGFFFSINPAMIKSKSGQNIISEIPRQYILTESDGPFVELNKKPVKPSDLGIVEEYLSAIWGVRQKEASIQITENFGRLLSSLKSE